MDVTGRRGGGQRLVVPPRLVIVLGGHARRRRRPALGGGSRRLAAESRERGLDGLLAVGRALVEARAIERASAEGTERRRKRGSPKRTLDVSAGLVSPALSAFMSTLIGW